MIGDVKDRKLVINEAEADLVHSIFKRFGIRICSDVDRIIGRCTRWCSRSSVFLASNDSNYLTGQPHVVGRRNGALTCMF